MTASLFAVSFSPSAVWSGGQVSRLPFFLTGAGRVLFALTILSYLAVLPYLFPHTCNKPIGRMVLQSAPMGFLLCFIEIRKKLFSLFQLQCLGCLVTNFCRTEVLDRTRIYIVCFNSPTFTLCGKRLERSTIQFLPTLFWITGFHFHRDDVPCSSSL